MGIFEISIGGVEYQHEDFLYCNLECVVPYPARHDRCKSCRVTELKNLRLRVKICKDSGLWMKIRKTYAPCT